jgi:pyruvate formate lyase activating enzyme
MEFKGFQKTSLIEYPGKIVSVVFTAGCNFKCPFCQNPDLVLNPDSLPSVSSKEVVSHLISKKKWLDGLAITGGEPMIHQALSDFIGKVKEEGFLVGIETNGANAQMLKDLIADKLIDYVALDIKAPLVWAKYKKAAGINDEDLFRKVKESVEVLLELKSDIDYELRSTVVPGLIGEEDILAIARQIRGAKRYVLQQFLPRITLDKQYERIKPYSKEVLEKMKKRAESYVDICQIRG